MERISEEVSSLSYTLVLSVVVVDGLRSSPHGEVLLFPHKRIQALQFDLTARIRLHFFSFFSSLPLLPFVWNFSLYLPLCL